MLRSMVHFLLRAISTATRSEWRDHGGGERRGPYLSIGCRGTGSRSDREPRLSPELADFVAKVPNRQELIFLLLKKSTDDR